MKTKIAIIFLCVFFMSEASAQSEKDARNVHLDSVTVTGNRYTSSVRTSSDGSFVWNMQMMDDLPKILGNADPIHYAQMLPGIQTNAEFQSGIHIQGCENSHNSLAIGGVPIYNVNHLLGFLSVFNATHYPTFHINKTITSASTASRLGGEMTMHLPEEHVDSLNGEVTVGLISSQGTIRLPLGRRTSLTASLRGSYINLLYGKWLNTDDNQMKYSFYDANVTITSQLDAANTVLLDFYGGSDDCGFSHSHYVADMKAKWGNWMGAAHWLYEGRKLKAKNTLYITSYTNNFRMSIGDVEYRLPSSITDYGYKGVVEWKGLQGGVDAVIHSVNPQSPESNSMMLELNDGRDRYTAFEGALHLDYTQPITSWLSAMVGVRGNLFRKGKDTFTSLDPSVNLLCSWGDVEVNVSYFLRHQYMFQTGFTDVGLPTEYWFCADAVNRPQYAHGAMLGGSVYLSGRKYRLSADVYYKRLYNQIENCGNALDYINQAYDMNKYLLRGKGENYGLSVMLNKCTGKLTGWVSYAFTHARRTFSNDMMTGNYPANHERPHEVNAVATYSLSGRWSFGTTFVYATGTPFTAPVSLSLVNGNLVTRYGEHNAYRLNPYCRLDLSVNYKWKPRFAREAGVNLSLYNVACRHNDLFYRVRVKTDGTFAYLPITFLKFVLPSVSYYLKF